MGERWPHGGLDEQELRGFGLDPAAVLDFSSNVNPLGASPLAVEAARTAELSRYPDPRCRALKATLAERLGVAPENVAVGNGSTELVHLVVRVLARIGGRPVVFAPTFSEFERACAAVGLRPFAWQAQEERGFRWSLANKPQVLRRERPLAVYLCNPNNPTGVYLSERDVRGLAEASLGGPLLLDEAYRPFVDEPWESVPLIHGGRVACLRSLTKDLGIPALRIGYLVAEAGLVQAVESLQPTWSVSGVAQAAAQAGIADEEHLAAARQAVRAGKRVLVAGLGALGLQVQEGAANFIMVRVGDAAAVRRALLQQGCLVRDCSSFGLPAWVRIAVRRPDESELLVRALAGIGEVTCGG